MSQDYKDEVFGLTVDAISDGDLDDHLNDIVDAITERRKVLSAITFAMLEAGSRVRIRQDANMKPHYLKGALGRIEEKRITKISVRFDRDIHDPYHKWAGRIAIVRPEWLEVVIEMDADVASLIAKLENVNGRTDPEAAAFRAKADELRSRYSAS